MKEKTAVAAEKKKAAGAPPPLPAAAVARALAIVKRSAAAKATSSVTNDEIKMFWRRKRMVEEEHLLAAQKSAAKLRARALTEEDYRRFEESLMDMIKNRSNAGDGGGEHGGAAGKNDKAVGIKDWWTKSKYAYLNQPAVGSMEDGRKTERLTDTYLPQTASSLCSSSAAIFETSSSWSLGVF